MLSLAPNVLLTDTGGMWFRSTGLPLLKFLSSTKCYRNWVYTLAKDRMLAFTDQHFVKRVHSFHPAFCFVVVNQYVMKWFGNTLSNVFKFSFIFLISFYQQHKSQFRISTKSRSVALVHHFIQFSRCFDVYHNLHTTNQFSEHWGR